MKKTKEKGSGKRFPLPIAGDWFRNRRSIIAAGIMLAVVAVQPVMAQDYETWEQEPRDRENITIFNREAGTGGFGALSLGYTEIAGRDALLMGGRAEWILRNWVGLGIGAYGFMNDATYDPLQDLNFALTGGYAGLVVEPIILGWWPVHITLPLMAGGGGVASTAFNADWENPDAEDVIRDAAGYFVAQGGAELEFNLIDFFRIGFFGYYRYTTDIIMEATPEDALRGWNYGVTFKFGVF